MVNDQRRRRNSITREEIVTAAFELYEAGSADVGLRAVAARIGAAPMSLYAQIATKEDLLDAVADRALAELDTTGSDETGDWLDDLTSRALRHLDLLLAHPWAVPILLARPHSGPAAARSGETYLRLLRRELDAPSSAVAFTALLALIYGTAAFLTAEGSGTPALSRDQVAVRIRDTPHLEHTAHLAAELADYGSPRHCRRAIRALLTGFRHADESRSALLHPPGDADRHAGTPELGLL